MLACTCVETDVDTTARSSGLLLMNLALSWTAVAVNHQAVMSALITYI